MQTRIVPLLCCDEIWFELRSVSHSSASPSLYKQGVLGVKQTRGFVLSMSLSTTSARTWGPRALSRVAPRLMHHCVCGYLQANLLDERASWKGRQGALDGNQVVNSDPPDPRVKGGAQGSFRAVFVIRGTLDRQRMPRFFACEDSL